MLESYIVHMLSGPIPFLLTFELNVHNYYPTRHGCCCSSCSQIRLRTVLRNHRSGDPDPQTDDVHQVLPVPPRTASLAGRAFDGSNGQGIRHNLADPRSATVEVRSDQACC